MHIHDALDQLAHIHDQMTRAAAYRGFRVRAVALVGVVGLVAAAAQQLIPAASEPVGFVAYWTAVAAACGAIGCGVALHTYFTREDAFARRRTRRVAAQFAPCVAAGGVVTAAFAQGGPDLVWFLPGVWAVVFGLGVIAVRPHLLPAVGWVGLGYLVAGCALLLRPPPPEFAGWAVGGVFGVGHLLTAVVLQPISGDSDD